MYPSVKNVTLGDNYTLYIAFDNGEKGRLDIKPLLDFGVFRKLKDEKEFRKVRVKYDAVEWECSVDLDPEYVYEKAERKETA